MLKDPGDSEERPAPRGFAGGDPLLSWLLTLPPAGRLTRNPATPRVRVAAAARLPAAASAASVRGRLGAVAQWVRARTRRHGPTVQG